MEQYLPELVEYFKLTLPQLSDQDLTTFVFKRLLQTLQNKTFVL
jgi:hypothetical protein